jgi:hypothetical protein
MKMRTSLLILALGLFAGTVSAQSMKKWTWDSYKMAFSVPADFKVLEKSSTMFSAGNEDINLTIYPEKGETVTKAEMKNLLRAWARDNKLKFDGSPEIMTDLNRYWGVYIDGVANELPTSILMLIDPDYPDIKHYVWIQYAADEEDTAVKILTSFIPN